MPVVYQGFLIYGPAPGKLIGCEVDLPAWFDHLLIIGNFSYKKGLVQ